MNYIALSKVHILNLKQRKVIRTILRDNKKKRLLPDASK